MEIKKKKISLSAYPSKLVLSGAFVIFHSLMFMIDEFIVTTCTEKKFIQISNCQLKICVYKQPKKSFVIETSCTNMMFNKVKIHAQNLLYFFLNEMLKQWKKTSQVDNI